MREKEYRIPRKINVARASITQAINAAPAGRPRERERRMIAAGYITAKGSAISSSPAKWLRFT